MQPARHIALQGASNFRDFGGYSAAGGRQVKWRRLFRSDRLSELTPADYEILAEHGIRHVYDLRRDSETLSAPTNWPGEAAPVLVRAPLFNDEAGGLNVLQRLAANDEARNDPETARAVMRDLYLNMVTRPSPLAAIGGIFTRLAEPQGFPALFHCAGGKDRTGVVCALILLTLGVSREDVIADFMLTGQFYAAEANLAKRVAQIVAEAELGFWSEAALAPIFGVEPSYIETALRIVDEAGGVEPFLVDKAGVAPASLEALRRELLA